MVVGLLSGLLLWGLTVAVMRLRVSGTGWSLAGNGALIIPFGLGPAIVAGGWSAVILRMRGHARPLQLGLASGAIGLLLVGGSLLSLLAFGAGARDAGATAALFFGFLLYGWLLASAVIATLIPAPDAARSGVPWWSMAAILLLPVTLMLAAAPAPPSYLHKESPDSPSPLASPGLVGRLF